jgi:hypothetical protein
MSSQRRINASRANGARSKGPVTVEGKERSALNALRHGLLANTVVLSDENPEHFEGLVAAYVAKFLPADRVELSFVEQMAAAEWRQQRSWAIERAIVEKKLAESTEAPGVDRIADAITMLAAGPELALMHRYEHRQNRMYHRAFQNLLALRKAFVPNEPNPNFEHGQALPGAYTAEPSEAEPPAASEPQPAPDAAPAAEPLEPPPAAASGPVAAVDGSIARLLAQRPPSMSEEDAFRILRELHIAP